MRHKWLILTLVVLLVIGGATLTWAAEEDEASTTLTVTLPAFREIGTVPKFSDLDAGYKESSAETLIVSADTPWKLQVRVDSTDSLETKVKHNSHDFTGGLTTTYADIPYASGATGRNQSSTLTVKAFTNTYSNLQRTLYVKIITQD